MTADERSPGAPMSIQHYASLTTIGVMALAVVVGWMLRRRDEGLERRCRLAAVAASIPAWLFMQLWYLLGQPFDPVDDAPLHICDLGGVVAMFALALEGKAARWWRAVLFFWGIGLTTQAFATPVLTEEQGPTTMKFWLFWVSHGWVVGGAVYVFAVLGFRPRVADLGRAIVVTAAWLAAILTVNVVPEGGFNYGYVGPGEDQPGVVALLGPWPLRVAWMALIVLGGFAAIWAVAARVPGGDNASGRRDSARDSAPGPVGPRDAGR